MSRRETAGCRWARRRWPPAGCSQPREGVMCLGIPGEVVEVGEHHGLRMGQVRFGGITRQVCLEAQPDVVPGDYVLVHVGFAIARIDPLEAGRAWEVLQTLGQTDELADHETGTAPGGPGAS